MKKASSKVTPKQRYSVEEYQSIVTKAQKISYVCWGDCQPYYPDFCLEVRGGDVTYENLKKLSDLFQTKEINIGNSYEQGYYDSVTSITTLTFYNPKI